MTRRTTRNAALALSLVLLPAGLAAQQRVALAGDAAIYDLAGQVKLVPGNGPSLVASVLKVGRDAGKLRVETGRNGSWQTLRVIFPDDQIVYDRLQGHWNGTFEVRDDGTFADREFWREEAQISAPGGSGHRVHIRGSGSGLHAYADMEVQVPRGRRVAVFLGMGRVDAVNVNGHLWLSTSAGDAFVDRLQGNLHASSGSGDVHASDVTGDVVLDAGSGDVSLRGMRGGRAHLSAGSGNVEGGSLSATELDASTGSGDLRLENVSAPRARLSAGSGDVDLALVGALETLHASSGSGDVTLTLPASTSARLRVETGSGEIETAFPVTVTSRRHGSLVGSIGDGRGQIDVSTGSGSVRLARH